MPEPSFWQYLSGQVPEEIRTWPAECSLPAFHEVHDLLEPQGGVIPLYIYFLLFLCQTFPVFIARRLYTWWRGSASEKKRNPTAGSGKRSFIAWFQVFMAVSAWKFQIARCWESLHTNDWLVIYMFWISIMFIFFDDDSQGLQFSRWVETFETISQVWYAGNVTYIYIDIAVQLARCTPDVGVATMLFYLLCTMPASELIRPASVGWMKSYFGYIIPSLEDFEQSGKIERHPPLQACLLGLTFIPMLMLLGLFTLSVAVTFAACVFAFIGCGIIVIASACFFGFQAAALSMCRLTKPLTRFVEFGAKQTPSFLFCPALVYYGIFVNLQKEFLAMASGSKYNAGVRIANDELTLIEEFFQEFHFHWSPLQLPGLPPVYFEWPSFDASVPDLQRAHDAAFLTILFLDPLLAWIANMADWACSHHPVAPEPKPMEVMKRMVPRQKWPDCLRKRRPPGLGWRIVHCSWNVGLWWFIIMPWTFNWPTLISKFGFVWNGSSLVVTSDLIWCHPKFIWAIEDLAKH